MNCKHHVLGFVAALAVGSLLSAQEAKVEVPQKGEPLRVQPGPTKGQSGSPQSGNSWFDVTDIDLGTHFGHEEAVGAFHFKNPTGRAVAWRNITGSCTCTRAVF